MKEIHYALTFSLLGVAGVAYLFYLAYKDKQHQHILSRSDYQKELDRFFIIMRGYGFCDEEIAEMLFDIKDFEELKQRNRLASKYLNQPK